MVELTIFVHISIWKLSGTPQFPLPSVRVSACPSLLLLVQRCSCLQCNLGHLNHMHKVPDASSAHNSHNCLCHTNSNTHSMIRFVSIGGPGGVEIERKVLLTIGQAHQHKQEIETIYQNGRLNKFAACCCQRTATISLRRSAGFSDSPLPSSSASPASLASWLSDTPGRAKRCF